MDTNNSNDVMDTIKTTVENLIDEGKLTTMQAMILIGKISHYGDLRAEGK